MLEEAGSHIRTMDDTITKQQHLQEQCLRDLEDKIIVRHDEKVDQLVAARQAIGEKVEGTLQTVGRLSVCMCVLYVCVRAYVPSPLKATCVRLHVCECTLRLGQPQRTCLIPPWIQIGFSLPSRLAGLLSYLLAGCTHTHTRARTRTHTRSSNSTRPFWIPASRSAC